MPLLSELGDQLVKCHVVSRRLWSEATSVGGGDLAHTLDYLEKRPPAWWDGPPPDPPGLTGYQRECIQSRFEANELDLLRHDLVLNQFVLLDRLGHGGQGEVYRARQLNPARFAAVKVLIRETDARRQRFEQEAKAMIKIRHPAVARFYLYERIRDAHGDPTDEYLIAMEFVNGTDLQRVVRQGGPVPWPYAVHWMAEILGGLETIHRSGFIHRDIKPENLMVVGPPPDPDVPPDRTAAKLLDFGAANRVDEPAPAPGGKRVFVGTMEYAAPEQWTGEMDVASDLYALGGTLFFILTGRIPFKKEKRDAHLYMHAHLNEETPDLQSYNPNVPPEVNRLFHRMMAKDSAERGTAAELREEFLKLRPPKAPVAAPETPVEFTLGESASTDLEPLGPKSPLRERPPAQKEQNGVIAMLDQVLSVLERVFIPAHLQAPPEADLTLLERAIALLRQPLVLVILLVLLALVIVFL